MSLSSGMSLRFSEEGKPIMTSDSNKVARLDSLEYWDVGITEAYEGATREKPPSASVGEMTFVDEKSYLTDKVVNYDPTSTQPDLRIPSDPIISASYNGKSLNPYIG